MSGRSSRTRADDEEWEEDLLEIGRGHASSDIGADERTAATIFLYVPDLESRTGWSNYRVQRSEAPTSPRSIGFRKRDRSR